MTTHIKPGDPIPLSVLLFDKATTKFVQAVVVDHTGAQIGGSPLGLPHVIDGLYEEDGIPFPATANHVTAIYTVYNDALFTTPSPIHLPASELFVQGDEDASSTIAAAAAKALTAQPVVVLTGQDIVVPVIVDQKC